MNTITIDSQVIDLDTAIANINRILAAKVAKLGIEIVAVDNKINDFEKMAFATSPDEDIEIRAIGEHDYYITKCVDGLEMYCANYRLPLDKAPLDVQRELYNVASIKGEDGILGWLENNDRDIEDLEEYFDALEPAAKAEMIEAYEDDMLSIGSDFFAESFADGAYPEFAQWLKDLKQEILDEAAETAFKMECAKQRALGKDILSTINIVKSGFWDNLFMRCVHGDDYFAFNGLLGERTGNQHRFIVIAIYNNFLLVQTAVDEFESFVGCDDCAELWDTYSTLEEAMNDLNRYKFAA